MADITRRDLIARGAGLAGLATVGGITGCGSSGGGSGAKPDNSGMQAPELVSSGGFLNFPMEITYATNPVGTPKGVTNFFSRTYNGLLAGQTLRIKAGDHLSVPIRNNLPLNEAPLLPITDENTPHNFNTVNLHTHGFHVSPFQDDVLLKIEPTETHTYEYDLPANHPAGTMWYHPHKHGATAMHLFSGMSGVIIIEGDESNGDLNSVEEIGAADEIVFNINELNLDGLGAAMTLAPQYEVTPYTCKTPFLNGSTNSTKPMEDDRVFVVNGLYQPTVQMLPGQVVRLRMLNSSARTTIAITIKDSADQVVPMALCAMDGITIPAVQTLNNGITLAPANRADVMIRFNDAGTYNICGSNVGPNVTPGVLAVIEVAGERCDMALPSGDLPVPASLTIPPITEARTLVYSVNAGASQDPMFAQYLTGPPILDPPACVTNTPNVNFLMDGKRFDEGRVDQEIKLGDVIEWTLLNTSRPAHPHHIHIHPFLVMETSDKKLFGLPFDPPNGIGVPIWLDTVAVPGSTAAAAANSPPVPLPQPPGGPHGTVKLRQYYPDNPGFYVIHCHILVHEDIGMMQLVHLSS